MNEQIDKTSFDFMVAGVKFHQLSSIIDVLEEGDELALVLEPTNPYDKHAVRIERRGIMLGYIPKVLSEQISELHLKSLQQLACEVLKLEPEKPTHQQLMVRVWLP